MTLSPSIGHRHDVAVVEYSRRPGFHQASTNCDLKLFGEIDQPARAGPIKDRFRELRKFGDGQIADEPVAGDAAFGENNQARVLSACLLNERFDFTEVSLLVPRRALELHGGHT